MILRTSLCILLAVIVSAAGALQGGIGLTAYAEPAYSQETDTSVYYPFGADTGYSAVLYNNTNGMPTPEANAVVQTEDGFIWVGSYSGLSRYDGNSFEKKKYVPEISGVRSLFVDSKQRLWIGSTDNGIACLSNGEHRYWGSDEGMESGTVYCIVEASDGTIYSATRNGVFLIDNELNLRHIDDERIRDKYIINLERGENGIVYCLDSENTVFVLKDGRLLGSFDCVDDSRGVLNCILQDPQDPDMIYIGTRYSHLIHMDIRKGVDNYDIVTLGNLTMINDIECINGKIWICASNGIGVLENKTVSMLDNIPMNDSIVDVMQDTYGNYWFASSRQGIMKVVPNQFMDIFKRFSLLETVVNSTCVYDNKVFVGTDQGLTVLDKNGVVFSVPLDEVTVEETYESGIDLIELIGQSRVRSIISDSRGRLWISTWLNLGLICYQNGKARLYNTMSGIPSDYFRAVCEREDGTIAAAMAGGVLVIKNDGSTEVYAKEQGIRNTEILTVCQGENGDILAGSNGDGIYVISGEKVRNIGKNDGLSSDVVMRIKKDEKSGVYWIVAKDSLAYMTPDYKVNTIKEFPYSNNFDLYWNEKGDIWVLSSDGIYVVSAAEMIANDKISFVHYGLSDGLPCVATVNSYSALTDDGELFIAGVTGVARVNIDEIIDNTVNLRSAVPFIEADGEMIFPDVNGEFRISQGVRKVTVYPFVFNYSLTNPKVSYKLEGFEDNSTVVLRSGLAPVDYTNLFGGEYTFVLSVLDPTDGSEKSISVTIIKEKAFYEQVWFYVLCTIALVLLIFLGYNIFTRLKITKLEKKHKEEVERERLKTELSTANQIQTSMMPSSFPPFPDRTEFDLYASVDPAKEVGGDFYDFFLIDDDHLCLIMADVSGKGVPAALFMMISKMILNNSAMMKLSPAEILSCANDSICSNNSSDMFVTAWVGILEISTGRLTASNAGHEYPVIKSPEGSFELYKDKHGFVLGGMRGVEYSNYELTLSKGSKLFLYTDGVPEATDHNKQMLGVEKMVAALNLEPEAAPDRIIENVHRTVDDFVKDAEQFDDLTMLCLDYYGR